MAVQTITYQDKQYLDENASIAAVNKVRDIDMNEIKDVVNNNAAITLQNQTMVYSLEGGEVYSTSEIKTNKVWTDNKPIYRKVISFTSTTSPYQYTHNISNIDKIVNYYGYHTRGTNTTTFRPLCAYNTAYPTYYISVDSISKTQVEVFAGDDVKSSLTWHIVVEYTKTTD